MNGFLETASYISHAAASLNLGNGRMRIDPEFCRAIIGHQCMFIDNIKSAGSLISKEIHILKLLIRASVVPASYCGHSAPLYMLPEAKSRLDILCEYRNNLPNLAKDYSLLNAAFHRLIQAHFNKFQATVAYQQRSMNLLHFCDYLGIHLIANVGDDQYTVVYNRSSQHPVQFMIIPKGVKIDPRSSLMIELQCIEPFLPRLSVGRAGLFAGAHVNPGLSLDQRFTPAADPGFRLRRFSS
jgi:hypothetical protein